MKKKEGIFELEKKLQETNSKDICMEKFLDYLKKKKEIHEELEKFYTNIQFRKLKWKRKKKTQESESNFFKKIRKTFGKDCLLCIGNWTSSQQARGVYPSPVIGLRKKLCQRFKVVGVPEFYTTKTCRFCNSTSTKLVETFGKKKKKNKNNKEEEEKGPKTRDILKCEQCGKYLNRDRNAALNILENWKHFENSGYQHWDQRFVFHPKNSKKTVSILFSFL